MSSTKEERLAATEYAYNSNARRFTYIGGRQRYFMFYYFNKPARLLGSEEIQEKLKDG